MKAQVMLSLEDWRIIVMVLRKEVRYAVEQTHEDRVEKIHDSIMKQVRGKPIP